jgi:hypothetical protein
MVNFHRNACTERKECGFNIMQKEGQKVNVMHKGRINLLW